MRHLRLAVRIRVPQILRRGQRRRRGVRGVRRRRRRRRSVLGRYRRTRARVVRHVRRGWLMWLMSNHRGLVREARVRVRTHVAGRSVRVARVRRDVRREAQDEHDVPRDFVLLVPQGHGGVLRPAREDVSQRDQRRAYVRVAGHFVGVPHLQVQRALVARQREVEALVPARPRAPIRARLGPVTLLAHAQDAVRVLLPERLRVLQARAVQHVHLEASGGHRRRLETDATERKTMKTLGRASLVSTTKTVRPTLYSYR